MGGTTDIDGEALKKAATKFEELIDEAVHKVFKEMVESEMQAGNIDAGIYVQEVCLDRRQGLQQHVRDLDVCFNKLAAKLRTIASKLTGVDSDNAKLEGMALDEINSWVKEIKDLERPKPNPKSDGYNFNSGDDGKPTDQHFTFKDLGNGTYEFKLEGAYEGTDFVGDEIKGLGEPKLNPTLPEDLSPGPKVPDTVTLKPEDGYTSN